MLIVKNVTKSYGRGSGGGVAVVDFIAKPGEIIAVLGENGSGKTVFFRLLAGIEKPSSGLIEFSFENRLPHLPFVEEVVYAGLTNPFLLHTHLCVEQVLKVNRVGATVWDEELCRDLLRRFDLGAKRLCRHLSQGESVLLQLAVGIPRCPRVLLLDEALSVVDAANRRVLMETIRSYAQRGGIVLFSSHIESDVMQLASRRMSFDGKSGRLIAQGAL